MRKFKLLSSAGEPVEVLVAGCDNKIIPSFFIEEVKVKSNVIARDFWSTLGFTGSGKVFFKMPDGRFLAINKNLELMDYLYEISKFDTIYVYSKEYKNNYCD